MEMCSRINRYYPFFPVKNGRRLLLRKNGDSKDVIALTARRKDILWRRGEI